MRALLPAPFLLLLMAVTGCLEIPPPKASTAAPPPVTTADPAAEAAEEAQAAAYVYSPVGKRDPFEDPASVRRGPITPGPVPDGPLSPLQKFELDQLRLAFTNTATATPMAMVMDPNGRSHVVQIGDLIGKKWGKVSSIKREEIQVTETMADESGRIFPVFTPLRMPQNDENLAKDAYEMKIRTQDQ